MPGIIVVGSQWGDEGKGKIVDLFSQEADLVVRYQGGANAGHTLVVNGVKTILHLVPSGALHPKTTCLIASGVVLDIELFVKEVQALREAGHLQREGQLLVSDGCTLILPYHRMLDQAREKALGNEKIGTTGKGIGPAYEDRASRRAVLFRDLFSPDTLRAKLEKSLKEKNFLLEKFYGEKPFNVDEVMDQVRSFMKVVTPFRCHDASHVVVQALKSGKKVLFEGAQGTLLDLNHGTYPFVTSSSTIAGSACVGTGIGPNTINKIMGIMKAYSTRVGSGPFPTELNDEIGERIRTVGKEFGATTGRARRTGWIDLVALKYAIRINGITNLVLTNLDVLSNFDYIGACTHYEVDGKVTDQYPTSTEDLARAKPVIKQLKCWPEDIQGARSVRDLPKAAQDYVTFLTSELGTPIDVISVGPDRGQTLFVKPLFDK